MEPPAKQITGTRVVLISPTGEKLKIFVKLNFRFTNNEAEYESFLIEMRAAQEAGATPGYCLFRLWVSYTTAKRVLWGQGRRLLKYLKNVQEVVEQFEDLSVEKISREENTKDYSLEMAATLAEV